MSEETIEKPITSKRTVTKKSAEKTYVKGGVKVKEQVSVKGNNIKTFYKE